MESWGDLLDRPQNGDHMVQLYGQDQGLLAHNVGRYLAPGLRDGDGLVIISTSDHAAAIRRELGEDRPEVSATLQSGRILFLDARSTLDRLLLDGELNSTRFEQVIGGVLSEVRDRSTTGRVRAFGEMVALLWADGRRDAAIDLEELWNGLLTKRWFSLFCAYPLDVFAEGAELEGVAAVLRAHSHMCAGQGTVLTTARVWR